MRQCPECKTVYTQGEVFCPLDGARILSKVTERPEPAVPRDPLIGQVLGDRYKVIRRIGEGGMGMVYETEHVIIEKRFALKVLRDDFSSRPEVVERFRQEAKSASRIGNEHIVDISDFGETKDGSSFFVMEYLEGHDLSHVIAKQGPIEMHRLIDILLQCCRALGAAHRKGIVHRDMKPENIFLSQREDRKDFVKIVDFGIAKMSELESGNSEGRKLTKTGMIFGTPEYMSPEQATGKPNDHRVDVYALGVITYEMITGKVPFTGDSFMAILTRHVLEEAPSIDLVAPQVHPPEWLKAIVKKAMSKDPDQRFASCEEMGMEIEKHASADFGFVPSGVWSRSAVESMEKKLAADKQVTQEQAVFAPPAVTVMETLPQKKSLPLIGIALLVLVALGAIGAYVSLGAKHNTVSKTEYPKVPPVIPQVPIPSKEALPEIATPEAPPNGDPIPTGLGQEMKRETDLELPTKRRTKKREATRSPMATDLQHLPPGGH